MIVGGLALATGALSGHALARTDVTAPLWTGTVDFHASADAWPSTPDAGFRYTFRAVFPGKRQRGTRVNMVGTLKYEFEGYSSRGDPFNECHYRGSGAWKVQVMIYQAGGEGDPNRLAVVFYDDPVPPSSATGSVVKTCALQPAEVRTGVGAFRYLLPQIRSMSTTFKSRTSAFKRTLHPLMDWVDVTGGGGFDPPLRGAVTLAFKRTTPS